MRRKVQGVRGAATRRNVREARSELTTSRLPDNGMEEAASERGTASIVTAAGPAGRKIAKARRVPSRKRWGLKHGRDSSQRANGSGGCRNTTSPDGRMLA